jgi:hypothetical protein
VQTGKIARQALKLVLLLWIVDVQSAPSKHRNFKNNRPHFGIPKSAEFLQSVQAMHHGIWPDHSSNGLPQGVGFSPEGYTAIGRFGM